MTRSIYDIYGKGHYEGLMLKAIRPQGVIARLLEILEDKVSCSETITIFEWRRNLFYIVVENNRFGGIANARIGITVDVSNDTIFLLNKGGNCFVRGSRWQRIIRDNCFAFGLTDSSFYFPDAIKKCYYWYGDKKCSSLR